jgi:alkylated DNA repair dioxygenase AlkB
MACTYIFRGKTYKETELSYLYKDVRAYVNSIPKIDEQRYKNVKEENEGLLDNSEVTVEPIERINPLIAAGVKPTDMYGNAAKDIQMAEEATQFIGFQSGTATISSTNKYREAWGELANTGNYTEDDIVMVSGSGLFRGVTEPQIRKTLSEKYKPLLEAAISAGANFVIGNQYDKGNLSDKLVADYLKAKGYTEEKLNGYSRWTSSKNKSKTTTPVPSTQPSTSLKPKGREVKEGIYVNQDGLTQEEELELFNLIKPALENQAVRSNKGKFAPKMTGLNLNWDYVSNRRGKQTRVDVGKSLKPNNTYGWFTLSANGQKLYPITGRIIQLMSKATGIDVTNYDGAILNIYDQNSFIGTHPDIDESITAKDYPVVVVNLGGFGNIVLGTDKDYVSVDLKSGSGYLFGFKGKNRTIPHSTYASSIKGTLPALTTKVDGETYEAGSYRVTITMRRVMPLESGMPTSPAIVSDTPTTQPVTKYANIKEQAPEETARISESPTYKEFGTLYRFELVDGVPVRGQFKQGAQPWATLNPKNVKAKYESLLSTAEIVPAETAPRPTPTGKALVDELEKRLARAKEQGYIISDKQGIYSVTSPEGIELGNVVTSLEDALTLAEKDYNLFVNNAPQTPTDPADKLEDPADIVKDTQPAPVASETSFEYYGREVTVYFQNGIPVGTSLIQGENESNIKFSQREKAVIDFYKALNVPKQLTLEDQLSSEKNLNEAPTKSPDNPTKQLQGEQVDAYNAVQDFLERKIPITDDLKETFYNHSFFLSGPGGSGKTFISEIVLGNKQAALAAPTHQAKGVLQRNFRGKEVVVNTAQGLLGLRKVPVNYQDSDVKNLLAKDASGEAFFVRTLDYIRSLVEAQKTGAENAPPPPPFFLNKSGIFLIDESSMINGTGTLEESNVKFFEETGEFREEPAYVNPDLGILLQEYSKIFYEFNGFYPKIIFTGDIAQTPPIGVAPQKISELLDTLRKMPTNYAELREIRRSNNTLVKDLSIALRNEIIESLKNPEGQRIPNYKKAFESVQGYSDEWTHYKNYQDFLNDFINVYMENTSPELRDPNYTQYLNYNSYTNKKSVRIRDLVREGIFGKDAEYSINTDELILLPKTTSAIYADNTEIKAIELLSGTKMYVTSLEEVERSIKFKASNKSPEKTVTLPFYQMTGYVNHHEVGDGKNPIEVTIYLPSEKLDELKTKAFNYFQQNKHLGKTAMFPSLQETNEELLFENQELLKRMGAQLSYRELTVLFMENIPTFEYGYVMNNYKVQGSAIKFPFVDIHNVQTGSAVPDPLHIAMFLYTLVSRTQDKLYTYDPNWNANIKEGTRPTCG